MDDVVILSSTFEQHIKDLQEVFDRLKAAGLKLSPTKCKFAQILGHEISSEGISHPADRIKAIEQYPIPKTVKQFQRFLGLMNWFKKFIPGYSVISRVLYALFRQDKKFQWRNEHQAAFDKLNRMHYHFQIIAYHFISPLIHQH